MVCSFFHLLPFIYLLSLSKQFHKAVGLVHQRNPKEYPSLLAFLPYLPFFSIPLSQQYLADFLSRFFQKTKTQNTCRLLFFLFFVLFSLVCYWCNL